MMGIKNIRMGRFCALWLGLSLGLVLVPAPLLAGNTTGTTRTQTYQPGEPFTGLPGGAPGRGYGTSPYGAPYGVGPYGAPSVYCQNWPGRSPYPQYPGTGPNTPCGPAFQPPAPQPQPQPPRTMSCPATLGSEDRPDPSVAGRLTAAVADASQPPELLQAQYAASNTGNGLYVANRRVMQATDAPDADSSALPQWLSQNSLRNAIFKAMACSKRRHFEFASSLDLINNIYIRENIIGVMGDFNNGIINVNFNGATGRDASGQLVRNNPSLGNAWEREPVDNPGGTQTDANGRHITFQSKPTYTASQAIDSFRNAARQTLYLDCMMGVEMAVLTGVKLAFPARFDQLHPNKPALYGVGVSLIQRGARTSLNTHLSPVLYFTQYDDAKKSAFRITGDDMVPGDYAYLENLPTYDPRGDWNGENAIKMSTNLFLGLGLSGINKTESQLKDEMAQAFNDQRRPMDKHALGSDMLWTVLGAPVLNGDRREAGPFVKFN